MVDEQSVWRRLPPADGSVSGELAAGEAMLAGLALKAKPALRWYRSAHTALVLGAGQPLRDVDVDVLRRDGITLHRRASGGGAVLWTPELLMQDIVLPLGHPLALHDVSRSYEWLGRVWQQVFRRIGLATTLISVPIARTDRAELPAALQRVCFAGKSPAELMVDGRKLVGLAQVRRRYGFLFQVGIYRCWPAEQIARLLGYDVGTAEFQHQLDDRVTALDRLGVTPDDADLQQLFEESLTEYGVVALRDEAWRADELDAALTQTRFAALDLELPA